MMNYLVFALSKILSQEHDEKILLDIFKKFSCQKEKDLEDFLVNKAILYEKINFGRTYLIVDESKLSKNQFVIAAFFTISFKSIELDNLSNKKRRTLLGKIPGRDGLKSYPAFLIGQLGAWDKSPLSDLCRIFSSVLRVLRANTGRYLTEKRVKWSERGGAKMVTGLLSQAPREV